MIDPRRVQRLRSTTLTTMRHSRVPRHATTESLARLRANSRSCFCLCSGRCPAIRSRWLLGKLNRTRSPRCSNPPRSVRRRSAISSVKGSLALLCARAPLSMILCITFTSLVSPLVLEVKLASVHLAARLDRSSDAASIACCRCTRRSQMTGGSISLPFDEFAARIVIEAADQF